MNLKTNPDRGTPNKLETGAFIELSDAIVVKCAECNEAFVVTKPGAFELTYIRAKTILRSAGFYNIAWIGENTWTCQSCIKPERKNDTV